MFDTLIFGHEYVYEAERLVRAFFPPMKLAMRRGGELPENSYLFSGENHAVLVADGRRLEAFCEPSGEGEWDACRALYKVLAEYTGREMSWGLLTGVRPVKLIERLEALGREAAYFTEKLLIRPDKLGLAREVAGRQRAALAGVGGGTFSLYVGVPFCPTRCSYCSFVSHAVEGAKGLIPEYVGRLVEEIGLVRRLAEEAGLRLVTVYIGGGTPTSLSAGELGRVMEAVGEFDLSGCREYTVEAGRADTFSPEKLAVARGLGATRISVNPQSMDDRVLQAVGRRHTARQVVEAFEMAVRCGFSDINMDLIAGLPGDTAEGFAGSLEAVLELCPGAVTVHSLSLKRAADLYHSGISENGASCMVEYAHERLGRAGYSPYYLYRQKNTVENGENTGYARPGHESLYNILIMEEAGHILAAGCGASTKLVGGGIRRFYNYKHPHEYIGRFSELVERKMEFFREEFPKINAERTE